MRRFPPHRALVRAARPVALLAVICAAGACARDERPGACLEPGREESCTCADGEVGTRTCTEAGVFDACTCVAAFDASSPSGAGMAGTGSAVVDRGTLPVDPGPMTTTPTPPGTAGDAAAGDDAAESAPAYGPCTTGENCEVGAECSFGEAGSGLPGAGVPVTGATGFCAPACTTAAECPDPSTGTAAPECLNRRCQLDCTLGRVCPDGMTCALVGGAVCRWP